MIQKNKPKIKMPYKMYTGIKNSVIKKFNKEKTTDKIV
jgi:hypothetical protein